MELSLLVGGGLHRVSPHYCSPSPIVTEHSVTPRDLLRIINRESILVARSVFSSELKY